MRKRVKTKKGLDIGITGEPLQVVGDAPAVGQVALMAVNCLGIRPRLAVKPGQAVGLGETIFVAKNDPDVQFVSPGTGRIKAINRGPRRTLQSVVVELAEAAASEAVFDVSVGNAGAIRKLLLLTGLWTSFRTRPYDHIARSSAIPRAIFITAIDTRPLAPDPAIIVARRESEFAHGLQVIRQLGSWPVYLCVGPHWSAPELDGIQTVEFDGPHPAGLVGTHIHHLEPVSASRVVWHIGYQDVIAIGYLFKTGRLLTERVVSIAGPGALRPRLLATRAGANVEQLARHEVSSSDPCRVISGSVLDGHIASGSFGFLGRYDNQISIVPDRAPGRSVGWLRVVQAAKSVSNPYRLWGMKKYAGHYTTACRGRPTGFMPVTAFERIMPLDILPVPLLKALLVKDTDVSQALGCLELGEEDLALCSFVCPAKLDYGAALRMNLDRIEKEG